MKKKIDTPSAWDIDPEATQEPVSQAFKSPKETIRQELNEEPLYDLEGLMTDFPTAKELEKFVFDQTGIVLNIKGRSNIYCCRSGANVTTGSVVGYSDSCEE